MCWGLAPTGEHSPGWQETAWTTEIRCLTHKQQEIHERIISTEITDGLVRMHQVIDIRSDDLLIIVVDQSYTNIALTANNIRN